MILRPFGVIVFQRRWPAPSCAPGWERIGIYRGTGHEHFNGSLIVPVLNEGGNVTEVYGRKLPDNLRAGTAKHLYLPGPHQGVWNLPGIAACGGEMILTEALIDAMTF